MAALMNFSSASSDSSEDEHCIVGFLEWERRPYTVRERVDHFVKWDDTEFLVRFRLDKETVHYILTLIEHEIESLTDRNHSISPMVKLLLTLRFYALGTMQISVGDFCGVSKSSACKIIRQVSMAIAKLASSFIKMPNNEAELEVSRIDFYQRARFPAVIGSLDCTHIKINSPGGAHAESFRNRKGYFSSNVQTISSAHLKILDIVARWPGSSHDQTVFNNSRIKQRFESNEFGTHILVADSGYANTPYLAIPMLHTQTRAEELYNESLIRTRNPVERQYGLWKRRFPILSHGMKLKLETTQAVIIATAILHNIAIERNSRQPPQDPDVPFVEEEEWDTQAIGADARVNARERLLSTYFQDLSSVPIAEGD